MLQSLRDNSRGVVAGLLIGLLVIIFALTGAEALFTGGGAPSAVVTVNGHDITEQDVARQITAERRQMLSRFGESVPDEFLSEERLRPGAIETLVQRQLLVQEAAAKGMAVSVETLNNILLATEAFQGPDGRFDPDRYQQLIRSAGYTPATYRRALEEDMLINQLTSGIAGSGFVTPAELEQVIALSYQSRNFQYVMLSADNVADEVSISEAEVREYYENNQSQFTQEEQVAVDYVELSIENLMAEIDIPESELRAQFEQNQAQTRSAQVQRRVAHILIEEDDQERLDTVAERLAEGGDFAELARELSDDLGTRNQGGDLGFVAPGDLPEGLEQSLEDLSVGDVAGPVETEYGTHFVALLDERRPEPVQFEDQRDEIEQQLRRVQAENQFASLIARLGEVSFNVDDLSEVEEAMGLPVQNTGLFGRSGGEGIASNSQVIEAAFSEEVLRYGSPSDVLELSPSRVVVLKLTDQKDAFVRALEDVQGDIARQLRQDETRRLLAERGEQIEDALQRGDSVTEIADRWGLTVEQAEDVRRDSSSLPQPLINHAFSLPRPHTDDPVVGGVHIGLDYYIVALEGVTPGTADSLNADERNAMAQNLSRMLGQEDYTAYLAQLEAEAKVRR